MAQPKFPRGDDDVRRHVQNPVDAARRFYQLGEAFALTGRDHLRQTEFSRRYRVILHAARGFYGNFSLEEATSIDRKGRAAGYPLKFCHLVALSQGYRYLGECITKKELLQILDKAIAERWGHLEIRRALRLQEKHPNNLGRRYTRPTPAKAARQVEDFSARLAAWSAVFAGDPDLVKALKKACTTLQEVQARLEKD